MSLSTLGSTSNQSVSCCGKRRMSGSSAESAPACKSSKLNQDRLEYATVYYSGEDGCMCCGFNYGDLLTVHSFPAEHVDIMHAVTGVNYQPESKVYLGPFAAAVFHCLACSAGTRRTWVTRQPKHEESDINESRCELCQCCIFRSYYVLDKAEARMMLSATADVRGDEMIKAVLQKESSVEYPTDDELLKIEAVRLPKLDAVYLHHLRCTGPLDQIFKRTTISELDKQLSCKRCNFRYGSTAQCSLTVEEAMVVSAVLGIRTDPDEHTWIDPVSAAIVHDMRCTNVAADERSDIPDLTPPECSIPATLHEMNIECEACKRNIFDSKDEEICLTAEEAARVSAHLGTEIVETPGRVTGMKMYMIHNEKCVKHLS